MSMRARPTIGTRRIERSFRPLIGSRKPPAMSAFDVSPLLAFALTAFIIEITPGPNMTYLAALSLSHGARTGFAAVAGIALGLMSYGIAAALGLAALIDSSPLLYELMRWAGVGYLVW